METEKKPKIDFDKFVEEEVPSEYRQSWISVMFVWLGTMVALPSVLIGQSLISGMTFVMALVAGLIGYLVIIILTIFQGCQSTDFGRPTIVLAKYSFGSGVSNILFSLTISISLIGWYGVQTGVGAEALSQFLTLFSISIPHVISIIIMGIVVMITAIYGYKLLEYISKYTVPVLVFVFCWAFVNAFSNNGFDGIMEYTPSSQLSLISGIVIVIGSFVIGAVIAGDYTRFNKTRKDTIKSAVIGVVPIGMLLLFIGVYLTIVSVNNGVENPDIVTVLNDNVPVPFLTSLVLIVASWKTNITNAYSAGIAIVNGF